MTTNNQQVSVVANEEEIEVEQRMIIYTPTFEGKPYNKISIKSMLKLKKIF